MNYSQNYSLGHCQNNPATLVYDYFIRVNIMQPTSK